MNIVQSGHDEWMVPSLTQCGEIYKVRVLPVDSNHSCIIRCDICSMCLHQYRCSCPESAVKYMYNFCKHIHLLGLQKKELRKPTEDNIERMQLQTAEQEDSGEILEIVIDDQTENTFREQRAIAKEMLRDRSVVSSTVKDEMRAAMYGLLAEMEKCTDDQCRVLIKGLNVMKYQCQAVRSNTCSNSRLPAVVSRDNCNKKIEPQRKFPCKKKRKRPMIVMPGKEMYPNLTFGLSESADNEALDVECSVTSRPAHELNNGR